MLQLSYVLIDQNHRSEVLFTTAQHRGHNIVALFAGEKQKMFFDDVVLNSSFSKISCLTFSEYLVTQKVDGTVFLMDIPVDFELLSSLLKKERGQNEIVLVLLKLNKKYINMIQKKIDGLQVNNMQYSANKFVGANDKLRQLIEKNYDLNRAAFYAYGEYLNYFRRNLLKRIFNSEQLDVANIARNFGFTTAPRVKEGKFLTVQARKEKKLAKASKPKKESAETQEPQQVNEVKKNKIILLEKTKKISKAIKMKSK